MTTHYYIAVTIDGETRYQSMMGPNGWHHDRAKAVRELTPDAADRHADRLRAEMPGATVEVEPVIQED